MAQIRIDEEVYNRLKEAADFNKRTVGQHILFLLDNEITFNEIRGMLKNKTENPENGSGSQANKMVATGNEPMPVRESLPDDLEEALCQYKQISEDLKPEVLTAWCQKQSIDEAWSDEQARIEYLKRRQELMAERDEVAAILKENGVSIGM